jgi:hypothetical protein
MLYTHTLIFAGTIQQDRQCAYNLTLRRVHVTNVAVEKQHEFHLLVCVRLRARVCVHVGTRSRGHVHARACM